jgi:hypothetical protein
MSDEKREKELSGFDEGKSDCDRRGFLRTGLAAVAGAAAGYSIMAKEVHAAQTAKPVTGPGPKPIIIPRNLKYTAKSPNFHVFEPASQHELVKSVSPLLTQMVQEAGMQVDDRRMAKLQSAFEQRGMINVPGGGGKAADVNLKVSGSLSVDW